jgi:hypothetical protein
MTRIFNPFEYNPKEINVDGSSWSGNFNRGTIPTSGLSGLVPSTNVLAANASRLFMKGGSRKNNKHKYNRMAKGRIIKCRMTKRRTKHRHTKYCKHSVRRRGSSRRKGSRRVRSRSRSQRGGSANIHDWVQGVSANNTSYTPDFNIKNIALSNPMQMINTSRYL